METKDLVDARKNRMGPKEAMALLEGANELVAAKGKKVEEFSPGGKAAKSLVDAMLGPTGNLRAPCLVVGKTVLVGFNEEGYTSVFG